MKKLNVAIVGLSFGLEFVPIYLEHPDVESLTLVETNVNLLRTVQERYGIPDENCFTDLQQVLDNPNIDAVHLVTPPSTHAPLSIKVLESGKHCGCTIPMGMSIDELHQVIAARKKSGKNYMFLETTVFQREYFYVKELMDKGDFGKIQYMSCAHYQDMEGWPSYWNGFPPLMHPTHAIGPCLMLLGAYPEKVYAKGSGKIRPELESNYQSPFAFESALVSLKDCDVTIELERFLYGVARSYAECFRVYGEKRSFEWQQLDDEDPVIFTRTGQLEYNEMYDIDGNAEQYSRGSEITKARTCPLHKEADMADHTLTWFMSSLDQSSRIANLFLTIYLVHTGPVLVFVLIAPQWKTEKKSRYHSSIWTNFLANPQIQG